MTVASSPQKEPTRTEQAMIVVSIIALAAIVIGVVAGFTWFETHHGSLTAAALCIFLIVIVNARSLRDFILSPLYSLVFIAINVALTAACVALCFVLPLLFMAPFIGIFLLIKWLTAH
jgi:hypothetical protein